MTTRRLRLLFVCSDNAIRSPFAECLLEARCPQRFEVYSAGTEPARKVHPLTCRVLQGHFGLDASALRTHALTEFADVAFDYVVTLCERARARAGDWCGEPRLAHWNLPAPLHPAEIEPEFLQMALQINRRIELFAALPDARLAAALRQLGKECALETAASVRAA